MITPSSEVQAAEPRVIVVLPVYNEERHIVALLEKLDVAIRKESLPYRIIAVNDGSVDGTSDLLEAQKARFPLTVIQHESNQGLGRAIGNGLRTASKMASEHDVVITMDSDETHSPDLIGSMVRMIQQGRDVVIASRYQPDSRIIGVSPLRLVLSHGASVLFRMVFPTRGVRDFTCGYRAYSGQTLHRAISMFGEGFAASTGFECMVDLLLTLRSMGVNFGEVPIVLRYDFKQDASKMQIMRTIRRSLVVLARHRFQSTLAASSYTAADMRPIAKQPPAAQHK